MMHRHIETNQLQIKLVEAIQQAGSQYFRLVVLAGPPRSGKTSVLRSVSQKLGCEVLNVNLELSKRMLELTRMQGHAKSSGCSDK